MKHNKVINNAKWIIICKAAQSVLQLVIGMLTARYLGPANYGLINYAKSIVAFVLPVTQLGLNATLVRELVERPEKEGEILGTSLVMSILSSMLGMLAIIAFVSVANHGQTETLIVCCLYSLSLLVQAGELIQYWFHYKLRSKYSAGVMLIAYLAVTAYKTYLLASGKSVYWFALAYALEYGIIGGFLLVLYRRQGGQKFSATVSMAKELFSRSRYYILSSLMVTLFQNTDHVMLKIMDGDTANGIYTAAITCAGVASFVYAAIVDSARPMILANKKVGTKEYETGISKLYCVMFYLSLLQGAAFTLLAKPIVWVLYGEEYGAAVPVLRILVWYLAFSQMGRIRNIWILAEEKQDILWKINLSGALANVVLNAVAIPLWGAAGAALASFLTQFFTNFVLGFIIKALRGNNALLLKGIAPRCVASILREVMESIRGRRQGE